MSENLADDQGPGAIGFLGRVVAWVIILGVVAAITVAVLIPRIGGATPYTILTGSMQPANPPGTLVVVRPTDPEDIGVGQVITYQLESGKPTVVTHRVVEVRTTMDGKRSFITKGDHNSIVDAKPVLPVQVKGALWYSVPHLGRANIALSGEQRQLATLGVISVLFLYAGFMFTSALRDGTRRARQGRADTSQSSREVLA